MEVKEAIDFCQKEVRNSENFRDKHFLDKKDEIRINEGINGLKNIVSLIKSLESENKACREMWEEFKRIYGQEYLELETIKDVMDEYEQKYLGGK
jgi:hypothetical protein